MSTEEHLTKMLGTKPSPELLALAEREEKAYEHWKTMERKAAEDWRLLRNEYDRLFAVERATFEREKLRQEIINEMKGQQNGTTSN